MDPITLWILFLATGWIIRALVEDGAAAVAAARGHPYVSPRVVRREARQRLALERISAGGSPPLTIVFSERLADRIANPPERQWLRELREYLALVIADGFEDARTRHEDKRAEKRRPEQPSTSRSRRSDPATEDVEDDIVDAELVEPKPGTRWVSTVPKCPRCHKPMVRDDGRDSDRHADGTVTVPLKCYGCGTTSEHTVPDPLPRACRVCSTEDMRLTSDGRCSSCYAASKANEAPDPAPPPPPEPPPPPALPAPEPTRKDPSMTNTINGDVGSPSEALAYCEQTLGLNTACINELDVALAGLRGAGCGQQFLDIVAGGLTAADIFDSRVGGARVRYAKHVLTHADLTSDPDLCNTLRGYLAADKV